MEYLRRQRLRAAAPFRISPATLKDRAKIHALSKRRLVGLASLTAIAAAIFTVGSTSIGILATAVVLCMATVFIYLLGHRSRIAVFCAVGMLLALLPFPKAIPISFAVGGGSLLLSDLVMLVIIVLVSRSISYLHGMVKAGLAITFSILVYGGVIGMAHGATPSDIFGDLRGFFYTLIIAIGIAVSLAVDPRGSKSVFLTTSKIVVIYTAIAVAVEAFFQVNFFAIRSGAAVIYTTGGGESPVEAAQRLVPISGLTCVVITGALLGLWFSNRITSKSYSLLWPVIICGLFVGFQGFSRNNLIALAIIIIVCLMLNFNSATLMRTIGGGTALVIALCIGWIFVSGISDRIQSFGTQSLEGFKARVLGGLDPDTVAEDYSSQWRVTESAAGLRSVMESPMGTGFGVPYRGWLPGDPFTTDYGYTYLHNSYLWFPVKTGVLVSAIILILAATFACVIFVARNRIDRIAFTLIVSSATGLAIVMIVSPLPFSRGDGVLCGAVLGLSFWALERARNSRVILSPTILDTVEEKLKP